LIKQESRSRVKILQAATMLIDEGANWSWSLRDIADEANVPANSIFRQFGSREQLVDRLCTEWSKELENAVKDAVSIEKYLLNLRWLVENRKRINFLVAEAIGQSGGPDISDRILKFMPPLDEIVGELRKLGTLDTIPDRDLHRNLRSAIQAGLGLLMFESSPMDYTVKENEVLLQNIWQKMWQISTGQGTTTAPDFFQPGLEA
jgi:AcrR family transcriptional regulator